MIAMRLPTPIARLFAGERRRINRQPSALLARALPWASVMLGSLLGPLVWVASAPLVPPLGLLTLIAWRQLRPGLLPVWAGLPLGIVDDLYSGQPFGSAVLLWSAVTLVLDAIEARAPWRSFMTEWAVAAGLIAASLVAGALLANLIGGATPLAVVGPQIALAVIAYAPLARLVAALDRLRLVPFVRADR